MAAGPEKFTGIERIDTKGIDILENEYVKAIIRNATTYCRDNVPKEFIQDAFEDARYVYISIQKGVARGFACIQVLRNKDDKKYLYIDLICSAAQTMIELRATTPKKFTGKHLLKQIEKDARAAGDIAYIKLSSLDNVITYYHHFGYRFIRQCGDKEDPRIKENLRNLLTAQKNKDEKTIEQKLKNRQIRGFIKDFYKETKQTEVGMGDPEDRDETLREDGFQMILCLQDIEGNAIMGAASGSGGYKKRKVKKRTKKIKYLTNV